MKKPLVIALLILLALALLAAMAELPAVGQADAPVHTHVSARYIEQGEAETGAHNLVTAVLLNYRGMDTFGEVLVLFTALCAGFAVLLAAARNGNKHYRQPPAPQESGAVPVIAVSPVVSFVVRLLAPFIALFAAYVILKGHLSPGGGFQGGMILGALFIALTLVLGKQYSARLLPVAWRPWLYALAPAAFLVVGMIGLQLTGYFLGYPQEPAWHGVREAMMVTLEIAIGVGGAVLVASLFLALESD
ncbi:hydrogen gas-evolving membrane-bound hydrogenase subunit E [Desulfurivibrio dismutans]|uniref:hydrogen gas-evolving membrane-bound hydrogenase subunit E n=1 Tax=Desulfurivibrio dismutans TaxID=1398908 RepID=UPI0023D9EDD7|nr:hydrogen gas-evolving membrane-bound hydrogenase subunit E [Desulfurivibrio alkaliphilus]MDF1614416.1 MnhB domain-containing protein [Desulfurivibrio alkaliphilus]